VAAAVLGRKDYTRAELDQARAVVAAQLDASRALRTAVERDGAGESVAALAAFEAGLFNALVLVLDRFFVHRLRAAAGKDGNALNEVALIADCLINNGGVLRPAGGIAYVPERSVTGIAVGDHVRLTRDGFERLAAAFFTELEARFVTASP
jgi:hypothetical protein